MSGGYRKYLSYMIPRFASHPEVRSVLCAAPVSLGIQEWVGSFSNVQYVNCPAYKYSNLFSFSGKGSNLAGKLERFSPDVIFMPIERYYSFANVPVVNMVRNMEPLTTFEGKDSTLASLKKVAQYFDTRRSVKRSDFVVAISGFVKEFLLDQWSVPGEKVVVVYHGKNAPVPVQEEKIPETVPDEWKGNFLFTAGSIRPARGLEDIVSAMERISENMVKGLVIAGDTGIDMIRYREELEERVSLRGLASRVCWTGSLDEKRMAWCYRNCAAFVMTSRVESFGMIALEAMTYGCVCVAADNPCLPEIFGDAAMYYPPRDFNGLSESIRTVLEWNEERRNGLSRKAMERAGNFSWDITARETVEVLKMAIRSKRHGMS